MGAIDFLMEHIKEAVFSGVLVEAPSTILYSGQGVVVELVFDEGECFVSAFHIESRNRIEGLRVWIIYPGGFFFDLTDEFGILDLSVLKLKLLGKSISGRLVWLEERRKFKVY